MSVFKENKSFNYRGFTITSDSIYGWSLIDRLGGWCSSSSSIDNLKGKVDRIILAEEEQKVEQTDLFK